uniref:SCP domain-containing protein n=1 Tax=Parascaris univalens TaxID=6257 RepID=A0A915A795_PARUN
LYVGHTTLCCKHGEPQPRLDALLGTVLKADGKQRSLCATTQWRKFYSMHIATAPLCARASWNDFIAPMSFLLSIYSSVLFAITTLCPHCFRLSLQLAFTFFIHNTLNQNCV